ncbi:MAG: hypothetical protein DRJ50_04715, partial [Actinobacteria bacterium]
MLVEGDAKIDILGYSFVIIRYQANRTIIKHFIYICQSDRIITVVSVNDDHHTVLIYSEFILEDASKSNRIAQMCQTLLCRNNNIICTFKNRRRYRVYLSWKIDDDM